VRKLTGHGPTSLAAYETTHIAHVLEQLIRGYMTWSNQSSWKKHIFSYGNRSNIRNINTYFYRFEFQQRGTVHVHLLVWLKNISQIQYNLIRGDIPYEDKDVAFLVHKLQRSDKNALSLNDEPTSVQTVNNESILKISHPADAFAMNLRGYIQTILPTLCCRMDVQTTDGNGMILRYVTSYVSKWKDAYDNELLYSSIVTPYQAAYSHIKQMVPCEPEMWLHLSSLKMSWSSSRTKEYCVPLPSTIADNVIHAKYLNRPDSMADMTLLQWLRSVNYKKPNCPPYKSGNTLVSSRMLSPFSQDYFFQFLLLNHPHRDLKELYHPQHDQLPIMLQFFASNVYLNPHFWENSNKVSEYFLMRGNRSHYVDTLTLYIKSLHDMLQLWQKRVINTSQINGKGSVESEYQLDHFQNSIFLRIMQFLNIRDEYYSFPCDISDSESEDDIDNFENTNVVATDSQCTNLTGDWQKCIFLTGRHGTGKSQIICRTIKACIEDHRHVLVAAPTGILAARYQNIFSDDIVTDTVHGAFNFPVNPEESATVNWNIATYDCLIIDEISMIPKRIFDHILYTLQQIPVRPVVILAGDELQQQPIETEDGQTIQVENILTNPAFLAIVEKFKLTHQYRVVDDRYEGFLNLIRVSQPSQMLLDGMQDGRIVCTDSDPTDDQIYNVVMDKPNATVLTVSRRATVTVNNAIITTMFKGMHPLAYIQCDYEMDVIPLYKDMRVMVTRNIDKANGVVNGAQGNIAYMENETIFVELTSGKIVRLYPVTDVNHEQVRNVSYPIVPSYSMTITKSQGMNLSRVIIWFDCDNVPEGSAYVALSRIQRLEDLVLLTPILRCQIKPVAMR
jgi:hypothetical protein